MKKLRKQLEKQKSILSKRQKQKPFEVQKKPLGSRIFWKDNQRLRQTLLYALAGRKVKDVTSAIRRMDEGVYGKCVECGNIIDPKRLEAMPTATHCWDCQNEKLPIHKD
jgi:RNA polymerase-binding transcription factor DksA